MPQTLEERVSYLEKIWLKQINMIFKLFQTV
jgi:hypothetical protein